MGWTVERPSKSHPRPSIPFSELPGILHTCSAGSWLTFAEDIFKFCHGISPWLVTGETTSD